MDTALNLNGDLALVVEEGAAVAVGAAEKEQEGAAEMKNAPELAALEASFVALATSQSRTEYTTDGSVCQVAAIPTLDEIEAMIADAAHKRIEAAWRDLQDTRARIERERTAREMALHAVEERVRQTESALHGLEDERRGMEQRARAFLGGEELQGMLGKIHLACNARQLELEDALAVARSDAAEATAESQAANVTDALELQLAKQELERLESAAPDVAQAVHLAATAEENIAAALHAVKEGLLRDAIVLLDQAKVGNADPARIVEVEQALVQAHEGQIVRDLIARLNANTDQAGAVRRIRALMEAAASAGVSDKVHSAADRALKIARDAANARFAQARPIADHLASEGFVPVVGDGRIEVWKSTPRNGASISLDHRSMTPQTTAWALDHILMLRGDKGWITERPRVPVTCKELPLRVRNSRWFRAALGNPANSQ